jgi:hypothetical protein
MGAAGVVGRKQRAMVRAIVVGTVGVLCAWVVAGHSYVAYLAETAPETALNLNTDPKALLNLAEQKLQRLAEAKKQSASVETGSAAQGEPTRPGGLGSGLRLWAELASRGTETGSKQEKLSSIGKNRSERTPTEELQSQIEHLAKLALTDDPFSARLLSIIGGLADAAGDHAGAEKYMSAAAKRSIRESGAVYWLMRHSYAHKDYATALKSADALLRTRSQAAAYVMPVLVQMAAMDEARVQLQEMLRDNPPWRSSFLATFMQATPDARAAVNLLLGLRATASPPGPQDLHNAVDALIRRKQYEFAYYTWLQFLPPVQLASVGFLFNGSFESPLSGQPFDWIIADGSGVRAEIAARSDRDGQHALAIEFGYGRVEFRGVQQLIMLAPGSYEFKGQYKGELVGKRGLVWRVACADTPAVAIAESPMALGSSPKWKDITFRFTVPDSKCRAQYVRLELDARMASETLISGSISYDELAIVRIDNEVRLGSEGK